MVDIENAVFDRVATAFDAAYPNGARYSERTTNPARFPCLVLYQNDNYFYTARLEGNWAVFDVEVYSNKTAGAKLECKAIMSLVDDAMMSFGAWELMYCNPLPNADNRIYRMAARYRGVAVKESENDDTKQYRIYRK